MKAAAYIVGPLDGPGAALMDLGRRLGFSALLPYAGVAQAEQQANDRTQSNEARHGYLPHFG